MVPNHSGTNGGAKIIDIRVCVKKKVLGNFQKFSIFLTKPFFHTNTNIDSFDTPFGPKVLWDYLNTFLAKKWIFDFLGKNAPAQ